MMEIETVFSKNKFKYCFSFRELNLRFAKHKKSDFFMKQTIDLASPAHFKCVDWLSSTCRPTSG